MRIMVLGLRGFPGVQGGVETHAEHLYPLIAEHGCEVDVVVRSRYVPPTNGDHCRGVRLRRIWAPGSRMNGLEAFVHSFFGVLYGAITRPDVLHIHAVGPAIVTPLAWLLGLQTVVTHHGPDYDREKWGKFARFILRAGELLGMRFAHQRIVISKTIQSMIQEKFGCDSVLIPNGVCTAKLTDGGGALQQFGLEPYRYVILVSRFVPEKRHMDLIDAFAQADLSGWKLVLVGSLSPMDEYIERIVEASKEIPNLVLTDFQSGSVLAELYSHAGIFVLPSSHEGLPIALLEALSYGLPVLASDIPANLEVGLPGEGYFALGDVSALSKKLTEFASKPFDRCQREEIQQWTIDRYDWQKVALQTLDVYSSVLDKSSLGRA